MNKIKVLTVSALALAMGSASTSAAAAAVIVDGYIGADNNGHGDVIGSDANFQINSMTTALNGTVLTVSIDTAFAGKGGMLFPGLSNGDGIGYGDLFLSSSWAPNGTSADQYINDNAATGTVWSYGLSLNNRFASGQHAGTSALYSLNSGDNAADILMSDDFMTGGVFRNGQEVAVDRNGQVTGLTNNSSWAVNASTVDFTIDLAGTSLLNGSEIALHWGFTCQNDVIEGVMPVSAVPVPAAAWLFGSGLIGLVGVARRKQS